MALSTEKKVGFFFIACLVVLGVMLEVGQKWNPFENKVSYHTFLGSTTGLKVGDSVRLAGVEVGVIDAIALSDQKVRVDFHVTAGTRITDDTVATIRLTNLLGGQFLGLSFGSESAPQLPPGSAVKSRDIANIDIIVDNVSDLAKDARQLVQNLDRNQEEVMARVVDILDENRGPLRSSMSSLSSITGKIDRGEGSLGLLLNDRTLYADARAATSSLKEIAGRMERGEGTLGKLSRDDSLYVEAKSAVEGLNRGVKDINGIAGKINRGEGTIGKLVNDETLYTELKEASRNVKEVTGKINSGQGTLGKLVNEDKLYHDATATLKKTERAVDGLSDSGPISVLGSIIGTLF